MKFVRRSLKDALIPGLTNLPVLVADDDFIEHLYEQGFYSIELEELYVEYADWAKENVEA
jgi:hypothetical protein